jgi:multiple sugar transport system permease protein
MSIHISEQVHQASASKRRSRMAWSGKQIVTGILFLFLIYFLLPFSWLLFSSTKTNADLFTSFGLWFSNSFHLLDNLQQLFTYNDSIYLTWLRNTILYSTLSATGAALLAAMAGYAFSKFHFKGNEIGYWIVLGAVLVPNTALVIPLYFLMSKLQILNTPMAIILPSLVSPFGVYLMRTYIDGALPDEILDAARIDGASELRIFWMIALRLVSPGLVTVFLFAFVGTWNNYFLPLVVLSDPQYYPLTLGLASWNAQASNAGGGAQALFTLVITGALVSIGMLSLAFIFLQRYWQQGLTLGGVKA